VTRVLFFTDVHGNRRAYEDAARFCRSRSVDAVILGGDLFPTGGATAKDEIGFVQTFLGPWARSLERPVYAVPGNHDTPLAVDACESQGLLLTHRRVRTLGPFSLFGYPFVPITPFTIKDWEKIDVTPPDRWPRTIYLTDANGDRRHGTPEEIASRGTIRNDIARIDLDPKKTVYLVHSPPARTNLDVIYGGEHVGSEAWREYFERAQPPLTLHGHIHESPEMSGHITHRLGGTLCINPGGSARRLQAVVFDLDAPEATLERL
jgi:Icc-related predicted phosphoesterase